MPNFRVRYEIDVEADDGLSAARDAYDLMNGATMLPFLEVANLDDIKADGNDPDNLPQDMDYWEAYDLDVLGLGAAVDAIIGEFCDE